MPIHRVLRLHLSKEGDAEDRKEEQEQHQERADVDQFWNRKDKGLENLLQVLSCLDQLEHPGDPERPDDS